METLLKAATFMCSTGHPLKGDQHSFYIQAITSGLKTGESFSITIRWSRGKSIFTWLQRSKRFYYIFGSHKKAHKGVFEN